jgi:hypothetical protein
MPANKEIPSMRHIISIVAVASIVLIGNLACSRNQPKSESQSPASGASKGLASMSAEDKYKLYYAATVTNDKALQKEVVKKLGVADADGSAIPVHEFYIAFIDWKMKDQSFGNEVFTPEQAREYVNKHMPS